MSLMGEDIVGLVWVAWLFFDFSMNEDESPGKCGDFGSLGGGMESQMRTSCLFI